MKSTFEGGTGGCVQQKPQPISLTWQLSSTWASQRGSFSLDILSQSSTGSGFKAGASGLKTGVSGLENFNHFIIFQLYADF